MKSPSRGSLRAVHSDQLAPVQVKFSAQPHELPKDLPEGAPVVAAEVGDRLEVGAKLAQQPDHLQVAVRLDLQAPAGPNTVEIPVDVELQQIRRIVARAALVVRPNALEPRLLEIEAIDEGINETDRVVRMAQDVMDQVEDLVERQRFDPFAEILTEALKVCTPVIEREDVELRLLALCSLPRTNPQSRHEFKRVNGPYTL